MLISFHCNNYHNKSLTALGVWHDKNIFPVQADSSSQFEVKGCCTFFNRNSYTCISSKDEWVKSNNLISSTSMDISALLENDSVRLVLGLIIQMLLSYPIRFITPRLARYVYSTVAGTFMQYLVFGFPVFWIYVFGAAMYGVTVGIPGRCGGLVTLLSMLFLSSYHLNALIYRYGQETMDQIVLLMILVCKYSLFAYAYQDNYLASLGRLDTLNITKERKENMINERVSIIEYFGYLQFLPTALMGPPIEYRTYRNFMELQKQFANIPSTAPALKKLGKEFLVYGFFYVLSFFVFTCSYMKTDEFWEMGMLGIGGYTFIALTLFRFKFYSGWSISIASIHISGVSYTPEGTFTGVVHCNPWVVETSPHLRQKISAWNIMVQQWLRKCIYERSPFRSRIYSQLWVFMVSSFWHGFYAGYYFSFTLWFLQLYLQGQIFKYTKIDGNPLSKLYRKLGSAGPYIMLLISNWFFCHNATQFYLLEASLCFKLMAKMYYIPVILLVSAVIILSVLPSPKRKDKRAE